MPVPSGIGGHLDHLSDDFRARSVPIFVFNSNRPTLATPLTLHPLPIQKPTPYQLTGPGAPFYPCFSTSGTILSKKKAPRALTYSPPALYQHPIHSTPAPEVLEGTLVVPFQSSPTLKLAVSPETGPHTHFTQSDPTLTHLPTHSSHSTILHGLYSHQCPPYQIHPPIQYIHLVKHRCKSSHRMQTPL